MTTKTSSYRPELTAEVFNRRSHGHLPGLLGVDIVQISADSVIALADTSCGYGCVAHLPEGASEGNGARSALFRCTQMVLWPR